MRPRQSSCVTCDRNSCDHTFAYRGRDHRMSAVVTALVFAAPQRDRMRRSNYDAAACNAKFGICEMYQNRISQSEIRLK